MIAAKLTKTFRHGLLLAGVMMSPSLANSQKVPSNDENNISTAAALNLPATITVLGKADPHVHKATAIINNEIITETDIAQRLALVTLSYNGKVPLEEMTRLRLQILRNLIDETLQIQEAKANKIELSDDEIESSYARVASNQKRTTEQMAKYLLSVGSSERSLKRQIRAEFAWNRLLRRKVEAYVNVSDDEVNAILAKLQASKGTQEYRVFELYQSAAPESAARVEATQRKIIEQLRSGGSFAVYARQYSESSTAAVGGDLGWIRLGLLPESLDNVMKTMSVGQIAGPIPIPGGYDILYLQDTRAVLTADPRDTAFSLRQMTLTFPQGTAPEVAKARANEFGSATQAMAGCGQVRATALKFGAEVVDSDGVKARDLPAALSDILLKLQVGQSSPIFGSLADGVKVLTICGRDDPQAAALPKPNEINDMLKDQRVNIRAQRYLRDLRRDAIIEYR